MNAWEQQFVGGGLGSPGTSADETLIGWEGDDTSGGPAAPPPPVIDDCSPTMGSDCTFEGTDDEPAPAPADVVVTLQDIASFRPSPRPDLLEPDGWALVGRPMNLVSGASAQVVGGTLLARPAEVRFTPVAYGWDTGDGGRIDSASPGATWGRLGLREFSETPTSHVYAERGTYEVSPAVQYAAAYRFDGSGWRPIAGTLTVPSPPSTVVVGELDTVLVDGDCGARPSGPGC